MTAVNVIEIEALPRRESSQIKNNWGSVAREVKEAGRVAVTTHKRIEMVILSACEYTHLMQRVAEVETRQQAALDQLKRRFDERLAGLQAPDAAGKADDLFAARGHFKVRPKAGTF